jgi:diguanylate cyclase (GGDEF)-like protein
MLILSDITDRKRAEEVTRHRAEHDFLTGLPNRALFLDRLQHAMDSALRQRGRVALMYLDLDRFKGINDTFGHAAGDAVLKEVAQRLAGCVRKVDTVSRQGGDEFVVVLADSGGVDQAAHVANSVMHAVAQPVAFEKHSIHLSVSIGLAVFPDDGEDIETLLKHADLAMYNAKDGGRNAFRFFDAKMNAHVTEREQLLADLRRALQQGHFELEYLPEVDIGSGRVTGLEALLRWRHPQRGLLLPHSFMRVAEEGGLMVDIGRWVLEQACLHARQWQARGVPVVVAVNLSSTQFLSAGLVASVVEALRQSGLPPAMLELEVREEVLLKNDPAALATVQALRALGVQLTMDDFGTGYSSLSSLRRFPVSKLKIDRSFVDGIAGGDGGLIPAIIACARSLHLRVTAEGVETPEQLDYLRSLGCDEYQGWLTAHALDGAVGTSAFLEGATAPRVLLDSAAPEPGAGTSAAATRVQPARGD